MRLYDRENIDELVWPESEESTYAKKFLIPFIKNGIDHYIDNIEAKIQALAFDSHVIPITIIDEKYENSFVCSPYGHYVSYALEATHIFEKKALKLIVGSFVKKFGSLLRYGKVNKIIFVNSWLVPTDLYSKEINDQHIGAITKFLEKQFPEHAIAFRSINPHTNEGIKKALKKNRYDLIVSRQVFFTDTKKEEIFQTRIFKSDLKLVRESTYEVVGKPNLTPVDLPQILTLYRNLYIEKHSKLNPQLNSNFMNLLFDQDILHIKALKKDGNIEGVFGYFSRGGIMTAPFFGYTESQKSLYRVLSTLLMLEAKDRGMLLHQSAGASFYKKIRRAESCMEFMAVYKHHLPFKRKISWTILKWVMNVFATPFMKKY